MVPSRQSLARGVALVAAAKVLVAQPPHDVHLDHRVLAAGLEAVVLQVLSPGVVVAVLQVLDLHVGRGRQRTGFRSVWLWSV